MEKKLRDEHGRLMKGCVPWNKGRKGDKAWNEGLTAETDKRVKEHTKVWKEECRQRMKKLWIEDSEYQLKQVESHKNKKATAETRLKMRLNHADISGENNPMCKPEAVEKIRQAALERWADPEFRNKTIKAWIEANQISPNKAELRLFSILQKHFLGDYALNVKAEVMLLGGKIPDFVNVNGAKSCIELWGDYWHKGQDPQDRINYFKQFGYNTLIVWEHELNNEDLLFQRLTRFKHVRRKHSHC